MHFGLTEDQLLLQATLRDFTAKELPAQRRRDLFEANDAFDVAIWKNAAEVGVQGLVVPERYGGAGLEMLDLALAFEVLGESALPGPFLSHSLATLAILKGGDDAQRERWLPRLCSGEALATIALGEAENAWTPDAWRTENGSAGLRGSKVFVEAPEHAELIVVAIAGGGLAVVERGASGLEIERVDGVDRTRTLGRVDFDGAPAEALDTPVADQVLDAGRVLVVADALGAAWKLIRLTVDYVQAREQFGTKIAQFQSIKHTLADLAALAEPMRGLVWYAAHAFDHLPEERAREASTAKAHVTDRALEAGRAAVELHGGIGFTWECDVQFWVKRTMFDRTWLGSPRVHRERSAALAGW